MSTGDLGSPQEPSAPPEVALTDNQKAVNFQSERLQDEHDVEQAPNAALPNGTNGTSPSEGFNPKTIEEAEEQFESVSLSEAPDVSEKMDEEDSSNLDSDIGFRDRSASSASSSSPHTPRLTGSTPTANGVTVPESSQEAMTEAVQCEVQGNLNTADSSMATTAAVEQKTAEVAANTAPRSEALDTQAKHRQKTSALPSVREKVMSMTRQRDLPPKAKEEETKHLRELDEMRAASREADKRRKSEVEASKAARAVVLASALPTWEASILPNWRAVLHKDKKGKALRKLWWEGTMPVRWRGRLWGMCIGNPLAIGKGAFTNYSAKAKKWVEEERYPEDEMKALKDDVEGTLPLLKLFQSGGVMHDDLVDLLLAYTVYWDGHPKYPIGLAYPAAMLLVNMPTSEAFLSLVNLIQKSFLKSFYSNNAEEMDAYYRIFDTLLADTMPKVYANFSQELVRPSLYLDPWLTSVFVRHLPLDVATRIFDVFLLEGDSFLFRVSLVILQILEPRLFNPVKEELDAVFKGTDKGAVLVVKREKLTRGEMDGVGEVEEVYTEMGCTEKTIFILLDKLDWKEETWDRLVTRELPEAD